MNAFLRLLRYAAPYKGRLIVALAAMVVYAAGSVGLAALIKQILDNVLVGRIGRSARRRADSRRRISSRASAATSPRYVMTDVGQRVVMDVRQRLFRHLLDQSAAFFSRRTSGQLMSRLTNDVSQVQLAVSETAPDLLRESLSLVGFAGYLFYLDWRLAIVCMTAAPLVVYPLVRLGQRVRRTTRRGQEELAHLTHLATEGLTGHRIVKAFGAERREEARFGAASRELYRTNMKITGAVAGAAAADGVHRRRRRGRRAVVRHQPHREQAT